MNFLQVRILLSLLIDKLWIGSKKKRKLGNNFKSYITVTLFSLIFQLNIERHVVLLPCYLKKCPLWLRLIHYWLLYPYYWHFYFLSMCFLLTHCWRLYPYFWHFYFMIVCLSCWRIVAYIIYDCHIFLHQKMSVSVQEYESCYQFV